MQEKERRQLVGDLRGLMRDATPRKASNDGHFSPLAQGRRLASPLLYRWASARLEVKRLAIRYGWDESVEQVLQDLGAPPLKYLGPGHLEQLEVLLMRLRDLEAGITGDDRVRERSALYAA